MFSLLRNWRCPPRCARYQRDVKEFGADFNLLLVHTVARDRRHAQHPASRDAAARAPAIALLRLCGSLTRYNRCRGVDMHESSGLNVGRCRRYGGAEARARGDGMGTMLDAHSLGSEPKPSTMLPPTRRARP